MRLNDASVIVAQGDANHWSNAAYNGEENDDYSSDNHDDILSLKMRKIIFEEKNILAEILIYKCSISQ